VGRSIVFKVLRKELGRSVVFKVFRRPEPRSGRGRDFKEVLRFCSVLTLLVVPCLYLYVTWLAARLVPGFVRRAINTYPEPPEP